MPLCLCDFAPLRELPQRSLDSFSLVTTLDLRAAVAAELDGQRVLEAAFRADVFPGRLGFAPGASRRHFALDESIDCAHRMLRLLRGEHQLLRLRQVAFPQRQVVFGGNLYGFVLE